MAHSENIDLLLDAIVVEAAGQKAADLAKREGGLLEALVTGRNEQRALLKKIGRSGNLDEILDAERTLVETEKARAENTSDKNTSLTNSLVELKAAQAMLHIVRDPAKYREIDSDILSVPKNRKGALPNDQARQFFDAQQTRIRDLRKGRVDQPELAVINARHSNLSIARRHYITLQQKALGISRPTPTRDRGHDFER